MWLAGDLLERTFARQYSSRWRDWAHLPGRRPEGLCEKVRFAWEHPDLMFQYGQNARQEYEAKYCASKNLAMLMDIYAAASPTAQCLETVA